MLVEMRKVALLILYGTVFKVDLSQEIDRLWKPILTLLKYISPGIWILFPKLKPSGKVRKAMEAMDEHLYGMIRARREALKEQPDLASSYDLLTRLVQTEGMDDGLIRDQLLTMLIAGHDTSTALLAWLLYLLGMHPEAMERSKVEADAILSGTHGPPDVGGVGQLEYIDQVIKEALRLYPPIHVGNRQASEDLELHGYRVPAGTRVMYSIYLSHRDPDYWTGPEDFNPDRFDRQAEDERPPFTYVPFGGGPRNCIGAAFAQVESKVVLARLLHEWDLELLNGDQVRPYMGATLEPRPGVLMKITRRS
jgi:cytochrome P450